MIIVFVKQYMDIGREKVIESEALRCDYGGIYKLHTKNYYQELFGKDFSLDV